MKSSILLFGLMCGIIFTLNSQVESLEYLIEYNDNTSLYDCKIVINEGQAISYPHRIQFNAQYTIEVPTGTECSIEEYHLPLIANQNYEGTEPMEWEFGYNTNSPDEKPESDFYIIAPKLGVTSAYNNIYKGDTITLFSLSIDIDPCGNDVRPHSNDLEIEVFDLHTGVFDNGFTLGSINQLYDGNLVSNYGATISADDSIICAGSTTTIVSSNTQGTWIINDPSILSIDLFTGEVTGIGEGIGTITYTDLFTGCTSDEIKIEVLSASDPFCIVSTEDNIANDVNVYPNPARDVFRLESDLIIEEVVIYSLDSKIVFSESYYDSQRIREISIHDILLTEGLYIIEMTINREKVFKKLLVE